MASNACMFCLKSCEALEFTVRQFGEFTKGNEARQAMYPDANGWKRAGECPPPLKSSRAYAWAIQDIAKVKMGGHCAALRFSNPKVGKSCITLLSELSIRNISITNERFRRVKFQTHFATEDRDLGTTTSPRGFVDKNSSVRNFLWLW